MAVRRVVSTEFWTDDTVVEDFSPEDKLFMLYLLTNPHSSQLGIYKIGKKAMAFELGYSVETIGTLLDRFETSYKMLKYNPETHEIAIKNYLRHSILAGGKPVEDLLNREIAAVKDTSLIDYVFGAVYTYEGLNASVKNVIERYYANKNDVKHDTPDESSHESSSESYHDTPDESSDESYHDTPPININITNKDHKVVVMARARAREETNNNDDFNPFGDDAPDHVDADTLELYASNNIMNMYNGRNMEKLLEFRNDMPDALIRFGIDMANKYCKTGVPTYAYVETILKGFVKRKFTTVAQAEAAEAARQDQNARASPRSQSGDDFWKNVPFY